MWLRRATNDFMKLRSWRSVVEGLLGHATGKPRPRLDDTWFTRSRRSARAHPILEFARKLALCQGPGSNWGHMLLQTIALPIELPRRQLHFMRPGLAWTRHFSGQ